MSPFMGHAIHPLIIGYAQAQSSSRNAATANKLPQGTELYDFHNGRRPRHVLTPKLEDLVKKYHPKMVIVQLGTNWMDGFVPNSRSEESHYGRILDNLVGAIRSEPKTVNQIIWITPPD
jgi:hypothetical protein